MDLYWAKLDSPSPSPLGVGITAASVEDAETLVVAAFGPTARIAEIKVVKEFSELEQDHVVPNIHPHWMMRGIWFPQGFSSLN